MLQVQELACGMGAVCLCMVLLVIVPGQHKLLGDVRFFLEGGKIRLKLGSNFLNLGGHWLSFAQLRLSEMLDIF